MDLVEMDLDVEIDGDLLRELLEEQEGKDDNGAKVESMVEEEGNKVNPNNMIDDEQEKLQWKKQECHSTDDFEWLNMMDMVMVEPKASNNPLGDVIMMNWVSDDGDDNIFGMVDFGLGYGIGEYCYPSIMSEGFVSNEVMSYNCCLWENYDI
ncbi:hypothetical protein PIB30_063555 [Stylosanthes scabra]|uniref:Uncharacterized protein n=1 Tax=Stylosanthes scabra TaxID=79078 RepID=A0ABU6TM09_9FABA|nr:hypothetical protein [Stylosanthes scabra]